MSAVSSLSAGCQETKFDPIPRDWELKAFGDLFSFANGVNADKAAYGSGHRFVNVLETITHSHLRGPEISGRVELQSAVADAYSVKHGDVLFNRTSETETELGLASTYVGLEQVVYGGFVIRGRPKDGTLDAVYSGYALRAEMIRSQIISMGQGAIRSNIGQESLKRVKAPVPPIREQRAIAEALSNIDALLTKLNQLIAKKRDLKQAIMQRLLSANTRLPGFRATWGSSTVGAEFDVALGKMLDEARNSGSPKPYLGNKAVQWGRIDVSAIQEMPIPSREMPRYRLATGDLLVCEGGEIGRAAIWNGAIEECYYQKALHRLRPLRGFNPRFLAALLELWATRGALANYVTQTSIAHLPREKFIEVPIPVPSEKEQAAIVEVLSDSDAELVDLESRRTKTLALKQAMMQELLTGRIRLV